MLTKKQILFLDESDCHVTKQGDIWLDPNEHIYDSDYDEDSSDGSSIGGYSDDEMIPPPSAPQIEGRIAGGIELQPDTEIRLVRRSAAHLAVGGANDKQIKVYHSMFNGRDPRTPNDPEFIELPKKVGRKIDLVMLIHRYGTVRLPKGWFMSFDIAIKKRSAG